MKIIIVCFVIFCSISIVPAYAEEHEVKIDTDVLGWLVNIGIIGGLLFEVFRSRSESKKMKEQFIKNSYDVIREGHTSLLRLIIEKPQLTVAWEEDEEYKVNWHRFTRDDMVLHFFYCLCFDLFERIYADYIEGRLRLTEEESREEWEYWKRLFIDLSYNWMFWWTYHDIKKYLDKRFAEELENIIEKPDFVKKMFLELSQRPVS